jgi:hypothetical protein
MAGVSLDQIARMAEQLSPADKRSLIEHLARQIEDPSSAAPGAGDAAEAGPRSLRGIWQSAFPGDPAIDAVLDEIRQDWEQEWPEVSHP